VSQVLFLDSGPLGLLTHPQRSEEVIATADWLSRILLIGSQVIVPAIVYYELKRELLRAKKTFGIGRLDAFVNATPGRYLPLSDEALRLAAELWARSRQEGRPTAEAKALDIDVLLAAQALSLKVDVTCQHRNKNDRSSTGFVVEKSPRSGGPRTQPRRPTGADFDDRGDRAADLSHPRPLRTSSYPPAHSAWA
jgi:predicted nucleic acid-binding protein